MDFVSSYDVLEANLPFVLNNYQFISVIGKGSFSAAFEVVSIKHQTKMCAKVTLLDETIIQSDGTIIDTEIYALLALSHPNIVKLYDVFVYNPYAIYILDLCVEGTVADEIFLYGRLSIIRANEIMVGVLSALKQCHESSIAHRDIKPSNIFLMQTGKPKLGDFGLCSFVTSKKGVTNACGSEYYCAPEMFKGSAFCPFKADVYSLGITYYQILTGLLPRSEDVLFFPDYVDERARTIILKMVDISPEKRPSIKQLQEDPFFQKKIRTNNDGKIQSFLSSHASATIFRPNILPKLKQTLSPNSQNVVQPHERPLSLIMSPKGTMNRRRQSYRGFIPQVTQPV